MERSDSKDVAENASGHISRFIFFFFLNFKQLGSCSVFGFRGFWRVLESLFGCREKKIKEKNMRFLLPIFFSFHFVFSAYRILKIGDLLNLCKCMRVSIFLALCQLDYG
jgi:hypothetical protein